MEKGGEKEKKGTRARKVIVVGARVKRKKGRGTGKKRIIVFVCVRMKRRGERAVFSVDEVWWECVRGDGKEWIGKKRSLLWMPWRK